MKTCAVDGCFNPHRARGLCSMHWKREHGTPTRWLHACAVCGREALKSYSPVEQRRATCSMVCRHWLTYGTPALCPVPATHESRRRKRLEVVRPLLVERPCDWCGDTYIPRRHDQTYCVTDCKRRAKLVRRKAREADGHTYSWTHVMRVLRLLGGCCAYCEQVIEGPPDPDHVVPISRGGSNGDSNILPSCRPCNSDKRDLLLHEWNVDRARRGKPLVRTVLDRTNPAFSHLLPDTLASCAA